MINRAAPHATVKSLSLPIALLAAAAMLLVGLCGSAVAAKPIGKGGSIQACYKVKGKKKGSMRVVPTGKRCKKSERKLAWTTTGVPGQTGAVGAAGGSGGSSSGDNGDNGANGSNGNVATLESKIAGLNLKIDALEKVLDGVNNGELKGALDAVEGLTGGELSKAVESLPVLESVCTQTSGLTGGLDAVNEGIKGLSVLGLPSLALGNLGLLPTDLLDEYNCPAL